MNCPMCDEELKAREVAVAMDVCYIREFSKEHPEGHEVACDSPGVLSHHSYVVHLQCHGDLVYTIEDGRTNEDFNDSGAKPVLSCHICRSVMGVDDTGIIMRNGVMQLSTKRPAGVPNAHSVVRFRPNGTPSIMCMHCAVHVVEQYLVEWEELAFDQCRVEDDAEEEEEEEAEEEEDTPTTSTIKEDDAKAVFNETMRNFWSKHVIKAAG